MKNNYFKLSINFNSKYSYMPSQTSVSLANLSRKNLPNIVSDPSILDVKPILNGLFKFKIKPKQPICPYLINIIKSKLSQRSSRRHSPHPIPFLISIYQ